MRSAFLAIKEQNRVQTRCTNNYLDQETRRPLFLSHELS